MLGNVTVECSLLAPPCLGRPPKPLKTPSALKDPRGSKAVQILQAILVKVPPRSGCGAPALQILRGILVKVRPPPVVVERWRSRF